MKRTGAGILIVTAALGVAVGFLLDQVLTSTGRPTFTPAVTLPILLLLLGLLSVALAIPIRRATQSTTASAVNPFRALRIAMLAKASSIVGAAFMGVGARTADLPGDPARRAVARLDGHDHRDGRLRGDPRRRGTRRGTPLHHPEGRR